MHDKRVFHTLDGMRGLAALSVVVTHAPELFGAFKMAHAHLAVDLFFVLSGFVIAHAYDRRLAEGQSARAFLRIRLIRLFPLYLLGTLMGIAVITVGLMFHLTDTWTWAKLLCTIPFSVFMLPTPMPGEIYPANVVAWSLLFELAVNLFYALFWRRFTSNKLLLWTIVVSGLSLTVGAVLLDGINVGWEWSHFLGGLSRAMFGFFVGIGLYRLNLTRPLNIRVSPLLICIAVLVLLAMPNVVGFNAIYDLGVVFLIFPLMILAAARAEPSVGVGIYKFLGLTSYAVYTLHKAVVIGTFSVLGKLGGISLPSLTPYSGFAMIAGLLFLCWLVDRYYDKPVRAYLTRLNSHYIVGVLTRSSGRPSD
jgi:peptidoglycan/LPS O-acetylase OafA/YrhL